MTMTGRFVDPGIRFLAAIALVMAVMLSPVRLTKGSQAGASPVKPPRNPIAFKHAYGGQHVVPARLSLRESKSLQSDLGIEDEFDAEFEDELNVISPIASISFDILSSPCLRPQTALVSVAIAPVIRPLRC